MAIDTSVSPYFDDYSETKDFYKVLFKPGVAVQSRELNQTQTIFQNQIKRIGDYLFTDGQKVTGAKPSVNLDARTIRILDKDPSGVSVNMSKFLNKYVTSQNSTIVGLVEFVFEKNDPEIGDLPSLVVSLKRFTPADNGIFPEKDTLFFYNTITEALNKSAPLLYGVVEQNIVKNATSSTTPYSTVVTLSNATTLIEVGDRLVHPRLTKDIRVVAINSPVEVVIDNPTGITIGSENIQYTKQATCPTSIVTQDVAYFYKSGYLVRTNLQKIVPDKKTGNPTKAIGMFVTESIITSADDSSLLDPAIGSSNYFAPGADRLNINLSLATFNLTIDSKPDTNENIIPLITFKQGRIEYVTELATDSVLRDEMAQRTYDQAGSYVVDNFIVTPGVTTDTDPNLYFNVSGGKAYVGGKEVSTTSSTVISIPRPSTTETKTGYNITTSQGNYLLVKDVNVQGGNMIIPKAETPTQGEMYLEMHNVTNPTASNAANTRVGTLVFKNLEYDSSLGNATTQLKLFYHYYSIVLEAPATWTDWSIKYRIPATDGQYIANVFYSSPSANTLLGNYGVASTPCYALYREPGVDEVAYWYYQWANLDGKDIAKTKAKFATSILKDSTTIDYGRLTSSTKSFYAVINGSPFADGLLNVNQVRSIIGVNNASTSYYTTATYAAPFFYANIAPQGINSQNNLIIIDPRPSDTLVFPIGSKQNLQTVKNIRTTYTRVIRNAIFSSGIYTKTLSYPESFNLGDGTVFSSTARTNFIISIKSGATSTVKYGIWNFEQGSVTISSDSTIASFNLGDASFSGLADIEFQIQSDSVTPRTKTLIKDSYQFINVATPDLPYSLKIADIAAYTGIYKLSNSSLFTGVWQANASYDYNNLAISNGVLYKARAPSSNTTVLNTNVWSKVNSTISSYFIMSNGQKDNWYDHGYIKYFGATASIPGNVLVTYDYFTHNGDGPSTVDSYPATYYRKIPTYKSTVDSLDYNLRDCLDFRPRRVDGSNYLTFSTAIFPTSSVNTDADVTYYLGRTDQLYITKDSVNFASPYDRLYIESGVETNNAPSKNVVDTKTRLAIATLVVPPYAATSFDVLLSYADNRRFTMQDIAKIERTTIALDKAIKIQAVEIANLKSLIVNDNGDTLLKSGILVENFIDFTKADLQNGEYVAAIDVSRGQCYPIYSARTISLGITNASNFSFFNDLITAKYEEEIFITQQDGNNLINPNPGGIDDRRGRAEISKRNSFNLNMLQWALAGLTTYGLGVAAYTYATSIAEAGYGLSAVGSAISAGYTAAAAVPTTIYNYIAAQASQAYSVAASYVTGVPAASAATAGTLSAATIIPEVPVITGVGTNSLAATATNYVLTEAGTQVGITASAVTADAAAGLAGFSTEYTVTATYASGGTSTFFAANAAEASTIAAEYAASGVTTAAASAGWASSAWASYASLTPVPQVAIAVAAVLIIAAIAPKIGEGLEKIGNGLGKIVNGVGHVVGNVVKGASDFVSGAVNTVASWFGWSDIRMKENIVLVRNLKPGINLYTFRYKKSFRHLAGAGPGECYGLMAQEVEKVYPSAVRVESNGYKSINYSLIGI